MKCDVLPVLYLDALSPLPPREGGGQGGQARHLRGQGGGGEGPRVLGAMRPGEDGGPGQNVNVKKI